MHAICYRYTLRVNLYIRMIVILCNCNDSKLRTITYIYCFKTLQCYSFNRIVARKSKATATLNATQIKVCNIRFINERQVLILSL